MSAQLDHSATTREQVARDLTAALSKLMCVEQLGGYACPACWERALRQVRAVGRALFVARSPHRKFGTRTGWPNLTMADLEAVGAALEELEVAAGTRPRSELRRPGGSQSRAAGGA